MKTDFGVMSKRTTEWAAKKLLSTVQESGFVRKLRKAEAIRKIKAQPFFGSALPKPTGDTIKFRRPAPFKLNDEPIDEATK